MLNKNFSFLIILLFILTWSLSSCRQSKHPDFEKTSNDLYYKFLKKNNSGKKPKLGDILFAKLSLSILSGEKDSIMYSSKMGPDLPPDIQFIKLDKGAFKGDIMEGLAMMDLGDSAAFILNADSFFLKANKLEQLPPGIKPGSELKFIVKLVDIKSESEARKLISEIEAIKNVKDQELMKKAEEEEPTLIQSYLELKKINAKPNKSGLYFLTTNEGNGPKPQNGQKVTLHYTGFFTNGKKFDSSIDRNEPFTFTLGKGEVIAGWDEAVSMMKVGSAATIIIPSVLGYGSDGNQVIPPFTPLVFELQLLKAE